MDTFDKPITRFRGKYEFLSNYYGCSFRYNQIWYDSAEAAFQAQKTEDSELQYAIAKLGPNPAKKMGRHLQLREDWDRIRDAVMWTVLLQKFYFNLPLVEQLCATGNAMLVEGNTWGDTYWGVCDGRGENRLGYMLMQIRNYYQRKPVEYDRRLLRSLAYYL